MLKYLLVLALAFSFTGVAGAAGIPLVVDPKNTPEIWTQEVYNNDDTTLISGTAVVWDMVNDTTDTLYAYRTMWVNQTTTNDDINFAGIVVSQNITAGSVGTICIYGPVYARIADASDAVSVNHTLGCANGVEGMLGDGDTTANGGIAGWLIIDTQVSQDYGGSGGTDGVDGYMYPVFINPGYITGD